MTLDTHIFLVGPMGAGKTTIGRHLAALLERPFYDCDQAIEQRTGADIPWIFDVEGEAGFRRREERMLDELTVMAEPMVLATGGGAVISERNRELLSARGWVVYLEASVAKQAMRTAKDRNRPKLQGAQDPEAVLSRLDAERDPLYRAVAHLVVATDSLSAKRVASDVADKLEGLADG